MSQWAFAHIMVPVTTWQPVWKQGCQRAALTTLQISRAHTVLYAAGDSERKPGAPGYHAKCKGQQHRRPDWAVQEAHWGLWLPALRGLLAWQPHCWAWPRLGSARGHTSVKHCHSHPKLSSQHYLSNFWNIFYFISCRGFHEKFSSLLKTGNLCWWHRVHTECEWSLRPPPPLSRWHEQPGLLTQLLWQKSNHLLLWCFQMAS